MEHPLRSHKSFSTADSLDLRQLLAPDHMQSLISESVTLDTLSSSSSHPVPPFSSCNPLKLSIIGLGDHLKMFSGPRSQLEEPRIVITSPTSPRLKSMFKECLCISKWVECLTSWQAPGHVPWGHIWDQTIDDKKWLPEGSLYSPEDFSRALYQARDGYIRDDVAQQEPCAIVDGSLDKHPTTTERTDLGSSSGILAHMELVDMMRELKDLRNFFEGPSQEVSRIVQPEQPILPSLMISNSHCTFPLSLDSCQSFTLKPAPDLADCRGRKPSPPLFLKNETPSPELSSPALPTASLGSPSPKSQDVNLVDTSGLCIEEMINNLRLQCSSLALSTPPVDNSWSSPSSSASPILVCTPVKKPIEAEVVQLAESTIGNTSFSVNNASSEIIGKRLATLTTPIRRRKRTSLSRIQAKNSHKVGSLQTVKCTRTDTPDKKPEVVSRYTSSSPLLLRSSLAKHQTFRTGSLKSVRFALSPSDFEKDVASLMYDDVWRSSQVSIQNHLYDETPEKKISTPHFNGGSDKKSSAQGTLLIRQKTKSWHSTSTTFKVSSSFKKKERIKSIIIKPPLRHSMIPNIFYSNTDKAETQDDHRPQSLRSRGRQSLSRIIKGPIFSGKEHKRATVSNFSTRWEFSEKGTAVQDSVASESTQKKGRMSVPLRNILTRFK